MAAKKRASGNLKIDGDWERAAERAIKLPKADVPPQPKRKYAPKKKGSGGKPKP